MTRGIGALFRGDITSKRLYGDVAMSKGVEEQVVGDAREKGIGGKHGKSKDVMTSLEARLARVELAVANDHNQIGKLAEGIEKCSSEYE